MYKSLTLIMLVLLSCILLTTSQNLSENDLPSQSIVDQAFEQYKFKYKKSYLNAMENEQKKSVFQTNFQKLKTLECGACGITALFDKTQAELQKMRGLKPGKPDDDLNDIVTGDNSAKGSLKKNNLDTITVGAKSSSTSTQGSGSTSSGSSKNTGSQPISFDWRDVGMITPVKDQGGCGSCWAFATVGIFQSELIRKSLATKIVDLAEEYLLQCDTGSSGCGGGNAVTGSRLAISKGLPGQSNYPYNYGNIFPGICITSNQYQFSSNKFNYYYSSKKMPDSKIITQLLVRPLVVYVTATNWFMYAPTATNRVFSCSQSDSTKYSTMNHAVILVGYTATEWIIKNSWGTGYGADGYIYISRNTTQNCGIGFFIGTLA